MNGLDLFSGIGGLSLALEPWVQPVAYCEADRYAQGVLLSRMREGSLAMAPIWDDVRSLRGEDLPPIDIIFGGFPCQDISAAGVGRGMGGERSGLYTHIERLVSETKPTFVFLENVPAIRTRGLGRVVWGLASLGYDCRWTVVSAASVGAPHKRDRWFLLAHANGELLRNGSQRGSKRETKTNREPQHYGESQSLAYASSERLSFRRQSELNKSTEKTSAGLECESKRCGEIVADASGIGSDARAWRSREPKGGTENPFAKDWWAVEPNVGGTFNGVSRGLDRSGGLGDAEAKETGADEMLRELWEGNGAQALQWATRGLDSVSATQVLFAFMREYEAGGRLPREFVARQATPETLMRAMREHRDPSRSSLRRGSLEQYFGEYPNALRVLSQLVASRGETPWSNSLWEGAMPRIATGIPSRVDRLKCLGNAVVPLQARKAFEILIGSGGVK